MTPDREAVAAPEKSVLPIAKASAVMMSGENRTERVLMIPLKRSWMTTMIAIVPKGSRVPQRLR